MLGTDITERHEYSMATIKEIAALAGVSRGTVDRVLNDRGAVNPIRISEKLQKSWTINPTAPVSFWQRRKSG